MKTKRAIALALTLIFMASVFSACSSNKIPKGRYETEDANMAMTVSAITINGNNFTMSMALGMGMTLKYAYNSKTNAITLTDGSGVGLTAGEYKDGSIWYGGVEFKKVK